MFAHIFKARIKGHWELLISDSAAITNDQVISRHVFESKPNAKAAAKVLNATPHNY